MSPERLLLTQKYSIARIISSPSNSARLSFRLTNSHGPAPLARSLTQQPKIAKVHHDDPLANSTPKPSLKDRALLIKSVDFQRSIQKQDIDLRRLKVQPLCGDIALRKHIRPVFKSIVQKYKRSFHPSNASRGQNNTSDDPFMKTPRRIREMRDRYNTEDNRNQIRRLVVLNQVINENNRRQVRMRRNKTQSRSLSIH